MVRQDFVLHKVITQVNCVPTWQCTAQPTCTQTVKKWWESKKVRGDKISNGIADENEINVMKQIRKILATPW